MSRPFISAPLLIASLLVLGACQATPGEQSSSQAPQSAHSTPASDAQSSSQSSALPSTQDPAETQALSAINGEQWVTSLEPLMAQVGEAPMVFHDLRLGDHESFYRVVVEFSGEGVPGYFQTWTDTPVEQGRGRPLPVAGDAFLDLAITGTAMPSSDELNAEYYAGERNLQLGPLDVREDGTFEDTTHIVIGMDQARKFQIGFLDNPTRMVIDIHK